MKYTKELLQEAVDNSISYRGVLRHLGLKMAGGTQTHIKKRIIDFGIDTSHFKGKGYLKGTIPKHKKSADEILIRLDEGSARTKTHQLVRALLEIGREYKCIDCGNDGEWNGKQLTLQVDHIDGEWLNNERENLEFRCPNCHTQKTYRVGE
jgi:predicted RNA-binding Zn-ribbon protein involved in translation (DUF1610 family)